MTIAIVLLAAVLLLLAGIEGTAKWTLPENWPLIGGRPLSLPLLVAGLVALLLGIAQFAVEVSLARAEGQRDRASAHQEALRPPSKRPMSTGASPTPTRTASAQLSLRPNAASPTCAS